MLAGIIAYQVLQQENPPTIEKVNAILEKHPWYANQWQVRLQDIPVADHSRMLFMRVVVSSGDIHHPLHTAQIFNVDYPNGDRGRNENLYPGDADGATDGPSQVLGQGDYLKLESDTAKK